MGQITRFAVRSSGRVLADVRRPVRVKVAKTVQAAPAKAVAQVDPEAMTRAELVEMADAKGVDASGTKADIADRLNG